MVTSSNKMCRVDYDSLVVVDLIIFSLFNIYNWPIELKQSKV